LNILENLITFPFLLISISIHEFSHGWTAYKLGDNTAKYSGRLTLNPLAHIDPIGTIVLPLTLMIATNGRFVFGAAKPVPVNFNNLRNPKRDIIWVGAAGPASNFALALILAILSKILPPNAWLIIIFWQILIPINVILGIFNLIPIPPLDGSRIVMGLLPEKISVKYAELEHYGIFIVMGLMLAGAFNIIWPLVNTIIYFLANLL